MKEEIKFVHKQIKLPLFPVYYDIFFVEELLLAPTVISNKYPGVDIRTTPSGSSMTCMAEDVLGNKGIIALFALNREPEDPAVTESITFEATNLGWYILDTLEIEVSLDNCKLHSYVVKEIHEQITRVYKELEDRGKENGFDSDSDLGDI